jgi:hypothetical protein
MMPSIARKERDILVEEIETCAEGREKNIREFSYTR